MSLRLYGAMAPARCFKVNSQFWPGCTMSVVWCTQRDLAIACASSSQSLAESRVEATLRYAQGLTCSMLSCARRSPAHPTSPGGHDREAVWPWCRARGDRGESPGQARTPQLSTVLPQSRRQRRVAPKCLRPADEAGIQKRFSRRSEYWRRTPCSALSGGLACRGLACTLRLHNLALLGVR
jgi:hypothetical protein